MDHDTRVSLTLVCICVHQDGLGALRKESMRCRCCERVRVPWRTSLEWGTDGCPSYVTEASSIIELY